MLNSGLGLLENRRERFETGRGPKRDGRRETRINIHAYLEVATSRHSCVWHSVGSETPTSRARQHRTMATTMQAHSVTATRVATATAGVCRARSRSTRLGSVRHESKRARVALGGFSDGASPRPLGSRARSMSSRGPAPAAALHQGLEQLPAFLVYPSPGLGPAVVANTVVFVLGIKVLLKGLTWPGVVNSWFLGTVRSRRRAPFPSFSPRPSTPRRSPRERDDHSR